MSPRELHELFEEIRRYLAAVETFRAEGCAINWKAEA